MKKGIESLANSKFGVFVNKSTFFLRAPFKGKVSDAIKRVTNITKPLQWLSSANAWFKKIMAKIGLADSGTTVMPEKITTEKVLLE